jgi:hypothetical protein
MDDRQVNPQSHQRRAPQANPPDHVWLQGFHVVGWREHQLLVAEGHYRCPHCCRADTLETNAADTRQQ